MTDSHPESVFSNVILNLTFTLFFPQTSWWLQDPGFGVPGSKPAATWPVCSAAPGEPGNEGSGLSIRDALWPGPLQSGGWPAQCGIWWLWHGASTHAPWRLRYNATPRSRAQWDGQAKTEVKHRCYMALWLLFFVFNQTAYSPMFYLCAVTGAVKILWTVIWEESTHMPGVFPWQWRGGAWLHLTAHWGRGLPLHGDSRSCRRSSPC